jgi:hypothetical protein
MKKIICFLSLFGSLATAAPKSRLDGELISKLTGLPGQMIDKEGVYKVSFPRKEIQSASGGVKLAPPLGLTSWASFMKSGNKYMMMGDTVLTEDQVNPVMSAVLDNGLEVTALHNHFFGDTPKVMFMHIGGMGDLDKLAKAVGEVYAKVKETMANKQSFPTANIDPAKSSLNPQQLSEILKEKGDYKDGVFKVTIGRKTKMHGTEVGNAMGINTWAAFAGSDTEAVVDGDVAMFEGELQGVLKKLRAAKINVVAIHNHMTNEAPRIVFLHYWGIGPAAELAKGLRTALDSQKM